MTNPTKKRKVRLSQASWGTRACAHDPKTASPGGEEAAEDDEGDERDGRGAHDRPDDADPARAAMVRPSRGSPRTAASGQDGEAGHERRAAPSRR